MLLVTVSDEMCISDSISIVISVSNSIKLIVIIIILPVSDIL